MKLYIHTFLEMLNTPLSLQFALSQSLSHNLIPVECIKVCYMLSHISFKLLTREIILSFILMPTDKHSYRKIGKSWCSPILQSSQIICSRRGFFFIISSWEIEKETFHQFYKLRRVIEHVALFWNLWKLLTEVYCSDSNKQYQIKRNPTWTYTNYITRCEYLEIKIKRRSEAK